MQLIAQSHSLGSRGDESSDSLDFVDRTGLETARIMENEVRIAREHHFVIDIMISTLINNVVHDNNLTNIKDLLPQMDPTSRRQSNRRVSNRMRSTHIASLAPLCRFDHI
jgi:hypothetical protein